LAAAVRKSTRRRGARRRGGRALVALAAIAALFGTGAACAQFAASAGLASENRYRGTRTGDVGPVLRASVMADSTAAWSDGAYAGLSGLWRTRDGGLANAEAMLGWSGRWNAFGPLATIDPAWGWDVGVHRMHYGAGARYDFNEAMVSLLGPGLSARVWWSPHYFGGPWASVYSELNGNIDLDDHWRVFAHAGVLHYGNTGGGHHIPGRTDALVGAGYVIDRYDVRLTRDGLVTGRPIDDIDDHMRRPAWVLSGSVAF
jgi:hypothetical protein